jgi:DNA-binding transcriptional LysR family regulator
LKRVTLRQLRIFEAAARHLSFSRAANELALTQPAVSMQMKQLEGAAGTPLFEHIGKRIYLTQAGGELLRHARAVGEQLREAEVAMAAYSGSYAGMLDVGVISTAKYFLPGLLAHFCRRFEQAEVKLSVHNREALIELILANGCDIAVIGQPPDSMDCVAEPFADNPVGIVVAREHPLSRRRQVKLAELANESWLIREPGSGTRKLMEEVFDRSDFHPARQLELGSNETLKQAVIANLGIAFLSLRTVRHEAAVGRLVVLPVAGFPLIRTWHVVHLRRKRLSPLTEEFRQFLIGEGARLIETL